MKLLQAAWHPEGKRHNIPQAHGAELSSQTGREQSLQYPERPKCSHGAAPGWEQRKCAPGSLPKPLPWQGSAAGTGTGTGRENAPACIAALKLYFPLIIVTSLTIKWTTFHAFSHSRVAGGEEKKKKKVPVMFLASSMEQKITPPRCLQWFIALYSDTPPTGEP